MTIGSRSVPDTDLTGIRLVPGPNNWRVEAVMRSGPALTCASGDHETMLNVLLWAGQELAKIK